jgi:hypothetical protein
MWNEFSGKGLGQIIERFEYENKLLASTEGGDILDYVKDLRILKRTLMHDQQLLSQACQNDCESSLRRVA